jgi:hypothetical protein
MQFKKSKPVKGKKPVVAVPAAKPRKGLLARVAEALGFGAQAPVRDSELAQSRISRVLLDNALRGEREFSTELINRSRKTLEDQIRAVRAAGDFRAPKAEAQNVAPAPVVAAAPVAARIWGVFNTLDRARLRAWSKAWVQAQAEAQAQAQAQPVATRARDSRGRFVKA